ncbi:ABC transporter ATP-binding protein [Algoriphagus halophytocola]|uniref:ATP-binding cassette domain-containing protein n=2 Tax=Algoriphagus halophytocola TaxID=2991499 RepID=A0ABY6MNU8_9BACT|nr:ATP-binding cassette domain-containing protein [Algoriphagus sp. TR-M5]UZD24376.1 ATP-binding cassette domain-containing protein [Algoriphagus sp. TR-M5]
MLFQSENISFAHPGQATMKFPDLALDGGEALLVLGKSGSGKTTFLNLLAGLLSPATGSIQLGEKTYGSLSAQQLDKYRGEEIGIVFQKPHLLAALNVKENLQMAQYFSVKKTQDISSLLGELGLGAKISAAVSTLSEGEAQRVSIARALANHPKLILADEPTASLDDENAEAVIQLLKNQALKIGAVLIIVTHDQRVKKHVENFVEVPVL